LPWRQIRTIRLGNRMNKLWENRRKKGAPSAREEVKRGRNNRKREIADLSKKGHPKTGGRGFSQRKNLGSHEDQKRSSFSNGSYRETDRARLP